MYRLLFTSALPLELKVVKQKIKDLWNKQVKIDFLASWMWNYDTIFNLTKYLEENRVNFIVNIWVCGYKKEKQDLIQVARIFNIWNKKENLVPVFFKFASLKSIACSEKPIFDSNDIWEESYVDMELLSPPEPHLFRSMAPFRWRHSDVICRGTGVLGAIFTEGGVCQKSE